MQNPNGGGIGEDAESLFFGGDATHRGSFARPRSPTPDDLYDDDFEHPQLSPAKTTASAYHTEVSRFHESGSSIKRRKIDSNSSPKRNGDTLSGSNTPQANGCVGRQSLPESDRVLLKEEGCSPPPPDFGEPVVDLFNNAAAPAEGHFTNSQNTDPSASTISEATIRDRKRITGPFIQDSDSDDDLPSTIRGSGKFQSLGLDTDKHTSIDSLEQQEAEPNTGGDPQGLEPRKTPVLKRESTSFFEDDGFDGIEDFVEDEFPEEGEEYIERRWMEEQRKIEMGLEHEEIGDQEGSMTKEEATENDSSTPEKAPSCPICAVNFAGITDAVNTHKFVLQ